MMVVSRKDKVKAGALVPANIAKNTAVKGVSALSNRFAKVTDKVANAYRDNLSVAEIKALDMQEAVHEARKG